MDNGVIDKIQHASNTEVVRRLLIKFFLDLGFDTSFDRHVYPPALQSLVLAIPVLREKVEVIPFAVDVDNDNNRITLGWNLFVLGNHRMFLGETFHNDLSSAVDQLRSGFVTGEDGQARRQTTPRRIISFIVRVLGQNDGGYINLTPPSNSPSAPAQFQKNSFRSGNFYKGTYS